MWEYLIHSSSLRNLRSIIHDDCIHTNEPEEGITGVYMHLLFDSSIYKDKYWHYHSYYFDNSIIYGFDTSILKTFPFKICPEMYFGKKCKDILLEGDGHLTKKPSLLKVKNHINKHTTEKYHSFMSSHEVIIRKNMPLSLCKFIMIHKEIFNHKYKKDIDTLLEKYPHIQVISTTFNTTFQALLNGNQ
jgi:hypothetical protein